MRYRDTKLAVFAGDIDEVGIENMLEQGVELNAKTLVFPHHGGNLSRNNNKQLVQRFLKVVSPTNIIFSIGRGLHATPQPEIVEAIREAIPNVYIACTQLSEHCADRPPKASPPYVEAIFAAGREKRVCCAGSIRLDPRTGDIVSPVIDEHANFIGENISTPLCK